MFRISFVGRRIALHRIVGKPSFASFVLISTCVRVHSSSCVAQKQTVTFRKDGVARTKTNARSERGIVYVASKRLHAAGGPLSNDSMSSTKRSVRKTCFTTHVKLQLLHIDAAPDNGCRTRSRMWVWRCS